MNPKLIKCEVGSPANLEKLSKNGVFGSVDF